MDLDYVSKTTKFYIKATGKKTSSMVREGSLLHPANIKVISKQDSKMDRDSNFSLTAIPMKDTTSTACFMERASTSGTTKPIIKEISNKTTWKEKVSGNQSVETPTKDSILKT